MKRSKNYNEVAAKVDSTKLYAPAEALDFAKANTKAKFDETVDVSMRLGVDPRKADQMVRGTVNLPNGTGKTAKVLVFATGDRAAAAEAAGADEVGADELIDKVAGGYLDFDAVVATPDLMGKVGRLGRVLGPRGLMPNPKTGTVTVDVAKAVTDIKGGKIEFRVDRHANLHFIIGKASFTTDQLAQNYFAALDEIMRLKPSAAKGRYLRKITLSTTMGPGIPVDALSALRSTGMDSCGRGRGQQLQRGPGQPAGDPLVHGDGAEPAVEVDRGLVPVQDGPGQTGVPALDGHLGQGGEQGLTQPRSAGLGSDVEILQVDPGALPGGEVAEVEGEADHRTGLLGDQRVRGGLGPEEGLVQLLRSGADLVGRPLVVGQVEDQLVDPRDVFAVGGTDAGGDRGRHRPSQDESGHSQQHIWAGSCWLRPLPDGGRASVDMPSWVGQPMRRAPANGM